MVEIPTEEHKGTYQEIVDVTRPTIPLCIPRTVWVPTVTCVDNGCIQRGGRCAKIQTNSGTRCGCIKIYPYEERVVAGNQPEFPQVNTQQGECPSFTGGIASGAGFVLGATAVTVTVVGLYKLLKK